MTPEEPTSRTAKLFEQALAHPPERRSAFWMSECAGDEGLYQSVKRLLDHAELPTLDVLPDSGFADPPALPESVHQRYENIEFLGRGGMGVVFRARDRELGTPVALKMLYPAHASDEQMVERLKNEIRLGREIAHKNVCRIHGLMHFDGTIFIEMEYVEGETLQGHTWSGQRGFSPTGAELDA